MIEGFISMKTIYGLTSIGIASFVGERVLERLGRNDLKATLNTCVWVGALGYTVYIVWKGIHFVSSTLGVF